MSKVIAIENIEPGMVVAESVLNRHGQTLMPQGATLKENHLRILRTWNVKFLTIKEMEDDLEYSQISPELYKIVQNELDKYLTWKPDNEFEIDLYNACINYKAKNRK